MIRGLAEGEKILLLFEKKIFKKLYYTTLILINRECSISTQI